MEIFDLNEYSESKESNWTPWSFESWMSMKLLDSDVAQMDVFKAFAYSMAVRRKSGWSFQSDSLRTYWNSYWDKEIGGSVGVFNQ